MDTTPIYALRERLRAAGIAGTSLLSEDFRLKRAYEAYLPLEAASPVFAKLGQMTAQLLSPDCSNPQGALLDTLTLADAVICTLAVVDRKGDIEPFSSISEEQNAGRIVNTPCSVLKELLDALTTSGGGHYASVCELHEKSPEIFVDYRVRHVLVQALDASYSELADKVEEWLIESNDRTMLPLLYQDFDPRGKKEMVRRVRIISALAGAGANEFYIRMLGEAQKDVRTELIDALRHDPQNIPLLFELAGTERGKNKDKVFELLAGMQDESIENFYKELAKTKPDTVLKYLRNATTDWSAALVAQICEALIGRLDTINNASIKEKQKLSDHLRCVLRAVFGKGGAQICDCYRKLLARKEVINSLLKEMQEQSKEKYDYDIIFYGVLRPLLNWYGADTLDIEITLAKILHHSLIANQDWTLQELALELYQKNKKFLPAVVTVKCLRDEDCADWLEKQDSEDAVFEALCHIFWRRNGSSDSYMLHGAYNDVYHTAYQCVDTPIRLSHAGKIMDWMKKHATEPRDDILMGWVPSNDESLCKTMGAYFYEKALKSEDLRRYLRGMEICGWTVCDGLAVQYFKTRGNIIGQWHLQEFLRTMPGDRQAKRAEAQKLSELMKTGKINKRKIVVSALDEWIQENL